MPLFSEDENMLDLCELHFLTLVLPQDRGKIQQFINERPTSSGHIAPHTDALELRRIWDYVEPQT